MPASAPYSQDRQTRIAMWNTFQIAQPLEVVPQSGAAKRRKLLFSILFTIYLGLTFIRFLNPANVLLTSAVTLLGLVSLIYLSLRISKNNLIVYSLAVALIVSFAISSIIVSREERLIHVLLFILLNSGIALLLLKEDVSPTGPYLVFYGLVFYFLLLMALGVNPVDGLEVTSGNSVSMMMIVACVSIYFTASKRQGYVDLLPAVLTFVVSIWAAGRSGIVSSFILLVGVVSIAYPKVSTTKYIAILVSIAVVLFFDELVEVLINLEFFDYAITRHLERSQSGTEYRLEIWENYFYNLDLWRVLFGVNVITDPWPDGATLAFNYHNTFIHLHLQTGFVGLCIILAILWSAVTLFKYDRLSLVCLIAVTSRCMTDSFIFFEAWDFVYYYLIALAFSFYFAPNIAKRK